MKKYLKTVTVTGASDDTSIDEMIGIQKEFPFVEWGILLSRRQAGKGDILTEVHQYPDDTMEDVIDDLLDKVLGLETIGV